MMTHLLTSKMTGVLLLCVNRSHSRWGELYESCLSWALECLRTVVCEVDLEAHNHMSWEEKFAFLGCRSQRLREHFNLGIQIGGLWSWVCQWLLSEVVRDSSQCQLVLKVPRPASVCSCSLLAQPWQGKNSSIVAPSICQLCTPFVWDKKPKLTKKPPFGRFLQGLLLQHQSAILEGVFQWTGKQLCFLVL